MGLSSLVLRPLSAAAQGSAYLLTHRSWTSRIGTGFRKWSFSRPRRLVTTRPASSSCLRCFITPKRVIEKRSASTFNDCPSSRKSSSSRLRRVGSARTLNTASMDRTIGDVLVTCQAAAGFPERPDNFKALNDAFGHAAGDEVTPAHRSLPWGSRAGRGHRLPVPRRGVRWSSSRRHRSMTPNGVPKHCEKVSRSQRSTNGVISIRPRRCRSAWPSTHNTERRSSSSSLPPTRRCTAPRPRAEIASPSRATPTVSPSRYPLARVCCQAHATLTAMAGTDPIARPGKVQPAPPTGPPRLEAYPRLSPFLQWPGRTTQELPAIAAGAPPLAGRLIDPFVGGGSVLFATPAQGSALGHDACRDPGG